MGVFDDIKTAMAISADDTAFVPAQRIDSLVTDFVSGEQRCRTDYAGTVWYGGHPQIIKGHPLPGRNAAEIKNPFWVPDSHTYERAARDDVQIQATAAVQGGMATTAGGNFQILDVAAALGEEAGGDGALRVFLAVTAVASLPLGVVYRVTVTCAPEAVRPAVA